jgi:mycothiol system anti-sigma-R factor
MSCGKPHATPCDVVLSSMFVYIDQEIDEHHRLEVRAHLAECAPCEGRFTAQIAINARVRRTQPQEVAPARLRAAIIAQIRRANPSVE